MATGLRRTRTIAYQQRQFELLVPALRTFQRLHGHLAVPIRFTVPNAEPWDRELQGMKLGTTISRFLKASASSTKPSGQPSLDVRTQLEELGLPKVLDWKRFLWNQVTVPAIQSYRSIHGDLLLMPVSFTIPKGDAVWPRATWGYKLGYWALEFRRSKDKLQQYQLEDLESLDFSWNTRECRWNRYFIPAMQRYQELYGRARVPQSFVVPRDDPDWPAELGGYRLGQKVNNVGMGNPPNTEGLQDVKLIIKNWMLLETLHEVEESGITDDNDAQESNEETDQ